MGRIHLARRLEQFPGLFLQKLLDPQHHVGRVQGHVVPQHLPQLPGVQGEVPLCPVLSPPLAVKRKSRSGLQEMSSCTVPLMSPRGIISTLEGLNTAVRVVPTQAGNLFGNCRQSSPPPF